MKIEIRERVQRCVEVPEDEYSAAGFIVPGTQSQIAVMADDPQYANLYAVASGYEIQVFDSGDGQHAFIPIEDLDYCFYIGRAVWNACNALGIGLLCTDEPTVAAAFRRFDFLVSAGSDGDTVHVQPAKPLRPPKRRKMTQKRLDGGEDMTV